MRRNLFLVFTFAIIAAACSNGDSVESTSTSAAEPQTTTTVAPAAPASTTTAPATTTVPATTTTTTGGIVAGEDPDVDGVVLAYEIVFSSATTYDEKVPYLVDPTGLEETVATYQETGESMGGITLVPDAVTIDGEVAEVQYDLLFGGTPTYPDLSGDAVLSDGVWQVTREMFCGMMTSARVGCPTS